MTKKQSAMSAADMQWRARKIAMQASRLADQAGPLTRRAAGDAAKWARPRVGRVRAWMAMRAARSSVAVQDSVAPRVSSMLATVARKLDPPKPRARRWPKVMAGTALLAAGAAAATAMAMRNRARTLPPPVPQRPPAKPVAEQPAKAATSPAEAERARTEAEVNGLSKTR